MQIRINRIYSYVNTYVYKYIYMRNTYKFCNVHEVFINKRLKMILSQYHFTQSNYLDRLILGNLPTVGLLRTLIGGFCKRQMQKGID